MKKPKQGMKPKTLSTPGDIAKPSVRSSSPRVAVPAKTRVPMNQVR
jgi:hypothetical protein